MVILLCEQAGKHAGTWGCPQLHYLSYKLSLNLDAQLGQQSLSGGQQLAKRRVTGVMQRQTPGGISLWGQGTDMLTLRNLSQVSLLSSTHTHSVDDEETKPCVTLNGIIITFHLN